MTRKVRFSVGDRVEITSNTSYHGFKVGDVVDVYKVMPLGYYARTSKANWYITDNECKLATKKSAQPMANSNTDAVRKGLVLACAQTLLSPNNTVTTLEIKMQLRKTQPAYHWTQDVVSKIMDEFSQSNVFTYTDNGTYRTYSDPTRKTVVTKTKAPKAKVGKLIATKTAKSSSPKQKFTSTITKAQARKLMETNKGHFFTATFIKTDGSTRVMNCQYLSGQTFDKTTVKVREASLMKTGDNPIRQIVLDRLQSLKIAGGLHKVGKK